MRKILTTCIPRVPLRQWHRLVQRSSTMGITSTSASTTVGLLMQLPHTQPQAAPPSHPPAIQFGEALSHSLLRDEHQDIGRMTPLLMANQSVATLPRLSMKHVSGAKGRVTRLISVYCERYSSKPTSTAASQAM